MTESRQLIRPMDMISVFFRSFLIQASWSFDRMQSLGFAFAMLPALGRLYPDPEEFRSRLKLHMEYFNTQPYLASFILGAAVRTEEERASGRNRTVDVSAIKNRLMAPLGALGDSFFWGALKPLSVTIAAAVLATGAWWAPLLFLVLYNSWHVWLRADLLVWGYHSAGDVVSLIGRYRFTRMARLFKSVSLAVLGAMLAVLCLWTPGFQLLGSAPVAVNAAIALLVTLALVMALARKGSPVKLMLGLAAVCIGLAYAGVV